MIDLRRMISTQSAQNPGLKNEIFQYLDHLGDHIHTWLLNPLECKSKQFSQVRNYLPDFIHCSRIELEVTLQLEL